MVFHYSVAVWGKNFCSTSYFFALPLGLLKNSVLCLVYFCFGIKANMILSKYLDENTKEEKSNEKSVINV